MKRPSFRFYPGDWRNDHKLRSCSLAAKGLWIEMLCIFHQSDRRGVLPDFLLKQNASETQANTQAKRKQTAGNVPSQTQATAQALARKVGGSLADVTICLQELIDAKVVSVEDISALHSILDAQETQP